ncbi:hypothetical protein [Pedobacter caeni]|uniref:Sulfate exporter family transporter n=1 Tax=Pedobacter caeni TaxID=288992 RepID=A0A1M5AJK0_9SPHI|nr:hypothetical protein [Pedobacter caeni]SHF30449.1 hypothetical protein SAMN04488522_102773 [Pedobacter caeni]
MELSLNTRRIVFVLGALFCLLPFMAAPLALLMGLIFAQLMKHPFLQFNQKATNLLLKVSVVGLGFGMNVFSAMKVGKEGLLFTVVSIFGVLLLGFILGKFSK